MDKTNAKSTKKQIIIGVAALAAVVIIIAIIVSALNKTTVDLKSMVDINFKGLDGNAKASYTFNYNNLPSDKNDSSKDNINLVDFLTTVRYKITPMENLKNGDTIKVSVTYNKDKAKKYKIRVKNDNFSVKVSGLKKGTVIDVFNNLKLEFSGSSSKGILKINKDNCDKFIKENVTFTTDNANNLKNGDTITVTANFDISKAEENLYIVKENKKTYTVSGLNEYLTDVSKLTNETKEKLDTYALKNINDEYASKLLYNSGHTFFDKFSSNSIFSVFSGSTNELSSVKIYSIDETKLLKQYLLTAKDNATKDKVSKLYLQYSLTMTGEANGVSKQAVNGVLTVWIGNPVIGADGKLISYDNLEYENPTKDESTAFTNYIASKSDYTVAEIK